MVFVEEENYHEPEILDHVYERELACIEVAKKATIALKGDIHPKYAPKKTIRSWRFVGFKTSYDVYRVPIYKSIYLLWVKYRVSPWGNEYDIGTLSAWLKILYGEAVAQDINVSELINDADYRLQKNFAEAMSRGVHISQREKWDMVVDHLSDELPPYAESPPPC